MTYFHCPRINPVPYLDHPLIPSSIQANQARIVKPRAARERSLSGTRRLDIDVADGVDVDCSRKRRLSWILLHV